MYIATDPVVFFVLKDGFTHEAGDTIPSSNSNWATTMNPINLSQHTEFFSYTPWTSNFNVQSSNLSDAASPASGFASYRLYRTCMQDSDHQATSQA